MNRLAALVRQSGLCIVAFLIVTFFAVIFRQNDSPADKSIIAGIAVNP